jgi:hypothetical protein
MLSTCQNGFAWQSLGMEPNQAAEHLQTIRTLMERSAIYRRALAPIMTYCGVVGIAGGIAGNLLHIDSGRGFVLFWAAVAAVALGGSFLLVRRQALKESEPFWSPPTRRVTEALIPPLFVGAILGAYAIHSSGDPSMCTLLVLIWCVLFGLAIHAAGFFMPRGLKWFGWLFIIIGCLWLPICSAAGVPSPDNFFWGLNGFMGAIFGGLHLAYGIYLYFTEKRGPTL